jgi:hypothetical protein
MSCISLPDRTESESVDETDFDPSDVSWPSLVQGIRVYAVQQPPQVASDLLQFADLAEAIGELQRR